MITNSYVGKPRLKIRKTNSFVEVSPSPESTKYTQSSYKYAMCVSTTYTLSQNMISSNPTTYDYIE